jgi:hypothetical protein
LIALKAIVDLKADNALRVSLQEVGRAAEDEIASMPAGSLAVAAAKLVVAGMAEARSDWTHRNANGKQRCNQRAAQATFKAIEWFGLEELYNAYFECREADA